MTPDRFQKLDDLGFKWSTTMPPKGSKSDKSQAANGDAKADSAAPAKEESKEGESKADAGKQETSEAAAGDAAAGDAAPEANTELENITTTAEI